MKEFDSTKPHSCNVDIGNVGDDAASIAAACDEIRTAFANAATLADKRLAIGEQCYDNGKVGPMGQLGFRPPVRVVLGAPGHAALRHPGAAPQARVRPEPDDVPALPARRLRERARLSVSRSRQDRAREGDVELVDELDADELDAIDELEGDVGARRELPPEAAFVVDQPSWFPFGSSIMILCGTTQSPHQWMSVRRVLSGVTSCVTSPIGSPDAWFVCSSSRRWAMDPTR